MAVYRNWDVVRTDNRRIRGIEALPAGPRQVDLGPRMGRSAAFYLCSGIVHITPDKARGNAESATGLKHECCYVPTRTLPASQNLFWAQNARFLTYLVVKPCVDLLVDTIYKSKSLCASVTPLDAKHCLSKKR